MAVLYLKSVVPNDNHPWAEVRLYRTANWLALSPTFWWMIRRGGMEFSLRIRWMQRDKCFDRGRCPYLFLWFCDIIYQTNLSNSYAPHQSLPCVGGGGQNLWFCSEGLSIPQSATLTAYGPGRTHSLLPALAKNMPLACFLTRGALCTREPWALPRRLNILEFDGVVSKWI